MAIQKNVISTDIGSYVHYWKGVPKSGKSTLFRDLVLLLYGDEAKGLLVSFGDEDGYKSLDRLQFEAIDSWDSSEEEDGSRGFVQLVDDLVENNNEYGIKMLCYDTIDKLIEVGTKEVLKLSLRETGKPCKSLNEALGGYGRGKERLVKIIQDQTARLKKIGLAPIVIGHTKLKDKTDELTGVEYSLLTSSLTADLDAIFGNVAQMIMMVTVDKEIIDGRITGTKRTMWFRDTTGLIEAGSRFAGLPESMPLSAENYMMAFKQGVQSSFLTPKTEKEIESMQGEEVTQRDVDSKKKALHDIAVLKKEIKATMKKLLTEKIISNTDVMQILQEHSVNSPDAISDSETAQKILTELKLRQ